MSNIKVRKRDGSFEDFNAQKIKIAVENTMLEVGPPHVDAKVSEKISERVFDHFLQSSEEDVLSVDDIHVMVENTLMGMKLFEVARKYITYRDRNKPDILRKRELYKPFEYPELNKYLDAIQESYWIHTEFNYSGDIQDFKVNLKPHQREAIRRCMLAISTVEVKVKDLWAKVGDRFPKPEIAEVGITFGESEVRHARAYSKLLELLGLNSDFEEVWEVPAIKKRMAYLGKAMAGSKSDRIEEYIETLLYFTLFVENVSLFSQFLIISAFNKEDGVLKGMSNAISATSLEENLHAMFGADLINVLRKETPGIFTDELNDRVRQMTMQSFEAESAIIDWIFEEGDDGRKEEVLEYIKSRYNSGLESCGFDPCFEVDSEILKATSWFDLQVSATSHFDFFAKRSTNYTKKSQSFTGDDLF